jgi:uncharacterized membrane protein YjgN (DUF898 family)
MAVEIELWQLLSLMAFTPFAAIGLIILFLRFRDYMLVRGHHIRTYFMTPARTIKTEFKKPKDKMIADGKRMYNFTPKSMFREGNTPTIFYNEESVDPIDPFTKDSSVTSTELGAMQTLWYADGARDAIKKGDLIKILVVVAMVAAIGACAIGVITFQTMNAIDGRVGGIPDAVASRIPAQQCTAPSNITVLT